MATQLFLNLHPEIWGRLSPILTKTCFSDGLGTQPPTTVDGRNPAPPGMVKTPINNGIIIILGGAGFCPSTVVKVGVIFGTVYSGYTLSFLDQIHRDERKNPAWPGLKWTRNPRRDSGGGEDTPEKNRKTRVGWLPGWLEP